MAQWANEVLETYKKVQRALVRARQQQRAKGGGDPRAGRHYPPPTSSEPAAEPPSPQAPRPGSTPGDHGLHGDGDYDEEQPDLGHYEQVPTEEPANERTWWTDEEWRQWRRERRKRYDDDTSSGEDLAWDELETEEIQVLPDEVLGWLLLRRANLSASSRLSVQASVQNSLFFRDIENALRDQEEELLQADLQRHDRHAKRRTYWVEEDGQWGLLAAMDETVEEAQEIHWVGSQLPADVYEPSGHGEEDEDIYWSLEDDGWRSYVQDSFGAWLETDGYTYWSTEDEAWDNLTPDQTKELEESYVAFENKAKTFLQSRQFTKAKGGSRGFYPMNLMKGKSKGKSKGKKGGGKKGGKVPTTSSAMAKPLFAAQGGTEVSNRGCFICGDHGHGFRNCPKRGLASAGGKGQQKGAFWVDSLTASPLNFIGMAQQAMEELIYDTTGYGVLDLGATETVGSLEALEGLMLRRGLEEPLQVFSGQDAVKPFRFGNGAVQLSASYCMIPQRLGTTQVQLGVYTLDAPKVPILLGMRTLKKLGAIVDVSGQWMVLSAVAPDRKVPLARSYARHLLLDLTQDWLNGSQDLGHTSPTASAYMVRELGMVHPGEHGEVWVVEGEEVETTSMDEVLMSSPGQNVDQGMRDSILQRLASSHGAQEGEEHTTRGRALRLRSRSRHGSERSASPRTSLQRGAQTGSPRPRERVRSQQTRSMDRLHRLRHALVLRAGMSLRTSQSRCGSPAEREETHERQSGVAGQEDRAGWCGEVHGGEARQDSRAEGRPGQEAGREGRVLEVVAEVPQAEGHGHDRRQGDGQEYYRGKGDRTKPSSARGSGDFRRSRELGLSDAATPNSEDPAGSSRDRGHPTPGGDDRGARLGGGDVVTSDQSAEAMIQDDGGDAVSPVSPEDTTNHGDDLTERVQETALSPGHFGREEGECRFLEEDEKIFLQQELEDYAMGCDSVLDYVKANDPSMAGYRPLKIMELCCEEGSIITKVVNSQNGVGIRCGLFNGCDLLKTSGRRKVYELLHSEEPDVVHVALPCGPTSSIQELNKLTEAGRALVEKKVAKSKRLAGHAVALMEEQVKTGRHVTQEWPRYNKGWEFSSIRNFWRRWKSFEAQVDGRAYGLKAPCGGSIKKPWLFRSTHEAIWHLQRKCSCTVKHVPCEGGQLTRMSAVYTGSLAKQYVRLCRKIKEDQERQGPACSSHDRG